MAFNRFEFIKRYIDALEAKGEPLPKVKRNFNVDFCHSIGIRKITANHSKAMSNVHSMIQAKRMPRWIENDAEYNGKMTALFEMYEGGSNQENEEVEVVGEEEENEEPAEEAEAGEDDENDENEEEDEDEEVQGNGDKDAEEVESGTQKMEKMLQHHKDTLEEIKAVLTQKNGSRPIARAGPPRQAGTLRRGRPSAANRPRSQSVPPADSAPASKRQRR